MDIVDIETSFNSLEKEYNSLFSDTEEMMILDNNRIKDALKNQLILEMNWELMHKKLAHLYDQCEVEVESLYSDALKDAMNDRYKEVTFSEAKIYAKSNKGYKNAIRLMNDIRHIRDECKGIVEVTRSRKYTLNNLSNLVVAGAEGHIL